ncbi:MAG: hypothetical protein KJ734_09855, partial [Chloroflexi bacterium]|nr:hypothetical protein [Chloroflexota bacterium]
QMLAQTLQAVEQQVPAPPTPTPEVVLPSAVDLVAPPPPAPARPEPVELPSAVDLVDQEPRRQVGLLTRFLRFLGFKGG